MDPKKDLPAILRKVIEEIDPYLMIGSRLRVEDDTLFIRNGGGVLREDLGLYSSIRVLGIGKASTKMGRALEEIMGHRISEGTVITKHGHAEDLKLIRVVEAGHPVPDENSVRGARMLYETAAQADEKTLLITLISGGGSSLFTLPREGVTLKDLQDTTAALLGCGADITEINCIRKHLCRVKGGQFAGVAYPARMISLILSDVVGDRLDTIASGITAPDPTTFAHALDIIGKYHIGDSLPLSVVELLEAGKAGRIPETPKPGDPVFDRVTNIILGNSVAACTAARDYGQALGYRACLITSSLSGEAREAARFFSALARDIRAGTSDFQVPALLVAGGETTVTIRGKGKGGRNQEMALAFLNDLRESMGGLPGIYFLSADTDGIDGLTDAAGALAGPETLEAALRAGMEPGMFLDDNDSYHFFEKAGGLIVTGPTNTNVCDIQLLAVMEKCAGGP